MSLVPWPWVAYLYEVLEVPTLHASHQIIGVSYRVASLMRHK